MPSANDFDDNYQPVAVRIKIFREKFPSGSLRPLDPTVPFRVVTVGGQDYISMVAAAFRTPDDPAPGVGSAWFPVPSRDEYTFNVELQRCETAAWGRAIIATLAADATKIASAEEVQIAQAARRSSQQAAAPAGDIYAPREPQNGTKAAPAVGPDPGTSVPQKTAPPVSDGTEVEQGRALIKQAMEVLADEQSTYQQLRDLWLVLTQANLIGWRVEPIRGMPADSDGMVSMGGLVSHVGKAVKENA